MTELFQLETFNQSGSRVEVRLRKLFVDYPQPDTGGKPILTVIFDEVYTGPAGDYTKSFTLHASNDMQVPIFQMVNGAPEPVMVPTGAVDEAGEPVMVHHTIGEFDMWKVLVFENNHVSIAAALEAGVKRKKGLTTEPLAFILP